MKLIDKILFYISVPKCVNCGERLNMSERGLCSGCMEEYRNHLQRNCSRCAKPLYECSCSNDYLDAHLVHRLIKVFRYVPDFHNPASALIYSLKRDNNRRVLDFLSDELAGALRSSVPNPADFLFTSVPRRRKATQKYGIDHAALLARATADKLGASYKPLLVSKSKNPQKKSGSIEKRVSNIDVRLKKESTDLSGKHIIIVDDIVTTGASMAACAMILRGAGARTLTGAVLSIAYKDKTIL